MPSDRAYRDQLVDRLLIEGAIQSHPVERAFRRVALDQFVGSLYKRNKAGPYQPAVPGNGIWADDELREIYGGRSLVVENGPAGPLRWVPPASILAYILERSELGAGATILQIGSASTNYPTALLCEIVRPQGNVTLYTTRAHSASDIQHLMHTYPQLNLINNDSELNHKTFDRVLAIGGCADIPRALLNSLSAEGFALLPLHHGGWFALSRISKPDATSQSTGIIVGSGGAALPPLPEFGPVDDIPRCRITTETDDVSDVPFGIDRTGMSLFNFLVYLCLTEPDAASICYLNKHGTPAIKAIGVHRGADNWAALTTSRRRAVGTKSGLGFLDQCFTRWSNAGEPAINSYHLAFRYDADFDLEPSAKRWVIKRNSATEIVTTDPTALHQSSQEESSVAPAGEHK